MAQPRRHTGAARIYSIIMAKRKIMKPDGSAFRNTEDDWIWLSEKAGKAARWLGYIPFDRIFDKCSNPPVIHRAARVEPQANLAVELGIEFPTDITPSPCADGFIARQAFAFALFAEKASAEDICLPFAEEHHVDVYLGLGEISDTYVYQIVRDAVADGRPLVLFTLADCDPSGWQMTISLARKVQALQDLMFPQLRWEIAPVALSPEQAREFDLPEEPIKKGDKRGAAWEEAFGVKQTEIDALTTPEMTERGLLRQMLDDAIAPYIDTTLEHRVARAEAKWQRAVRNAVNARVGTKLIKRLRREADRLQQQVEKVNDGLRAAAARIELPEVDVPQPNANIDCLDNARQAVLRFDTDWVAAPKSCWRASSTSISNGMTMSERTSKIPGALVKYDATARALAEATRIIPGGRS